MQMSVCVWLSPCAVHLRLTMNGILNQLYFNNNKGKNLCQHFLGSWQYVPLSFGARPSQCVFRTDDSLMGGEPAKQ